MAIRFFCPFGHRLKVPEERAGKKGRCPICRQRFIVPAFALPDKKPSRKGPWSSGDSSIVVPPPSEPSTSAEEPLVPAAAGAPVSVAPPPLPPVMAAIASNVTQPQTSARQSSALPPRRIAWATWVRGEERESFQVARATPRQLEMVYWLACLLPFAAIFSAAPAVPHIQFAGAPYWAQALLCLAGLQFVYAAWLATVPDRSAVRVGVYFLAGLATIELLAALVLPFISDRALTFVGLGGARGTAVAWCGLAVVVSGLSCAAFRWLDERWRAGRI